MHSRRSLEPELIPLVPEVNRLCREVRARSSIDLGSHILAGGQMPAREEPPRLLCEFFIPTEYDRGAGGMGSQIGATHYEIKVFTISMLSSFRGLESEDPYRYLDEFLDVYVIVRISHIEDDALRLRMFHFSLKEKATHWLSAHIC
ncbi:unnamed protein product [Victoria cruziana]